ncbi:MAG: DUF4124 domain-containing protein [Proteobacteria bacterium]|nr:DUF4124 domain-containing protein [Pseudomonadota bacterium]
MSRYIPICALLVLGSLSIAQADVYRWVDEKGEPHYSDQWVPGSTVVKTSKLHPGSDTMGAPAGRPATDRGGPQADDQANKNAVQADIAKSRDAQCKTAKDAYMKAILSRRVYKEGKDGSKDFLSDQEADAYREQARKNVQAFCGSVPAFDPNAPIPEPQPIPEPKVKPADATSP